MYVNVKRHHILTTSTCTVLFSDTDHADQTHDEGTRNKWYVDRHIARKWFAQVFATGLVRLKTIVI